MEPARGVVGMPTAPRAAHDCRNQAPRRSTGAPRCPATAPRFKTATPGDGTLSDLTEEASEGASSPLLGAWLRGPGQPGGPWKGTMALPGLFSLSVGSGCGGGACRRAHRKNARPMPGGGERKGGGGVGKA